jgi:hypothetical protein
MTIKSFIQRYQLPSYFVLAYGISWSGILILLVSKGFQLATIHTQDVLLMFLPMLLGPSTSSLVLNAVLNGRNGLRELWRSLARRQVGWPWYAAALLTIPMLLLAILLMLSTAVSPVFAPGFQIVGVVVGLLSGGLEEIGKPSLRRVYG